MKTILVTGAAGYIGRHVVKNALDRGYKVIAADFNFKGVMNAPNFVMCRCSAATRIYTVSWAARMSASIWHGGMVSAITPAPI